MVHIEMHKITIVSFHVLIAAVGLQGKSTTVVSSSTPVSLSSLDYKVQDSHSFLFQLRACSKTSMTLYTGVSSMCNSKGGYYVAFCSYTGDHVVLRCGGQYNRLGLPGLVNCNEYNPFWLSWRGDNLELGRGSTVGVDTVLTLAKPTTDPVTDIELKDEENLNGYWIIEFADISAGHYWVAFLEARDVNITDNVLWQRTVHQGACYIMCYSDQQCLSFIFNNFLKICQGHSVGYIRINTTNSILEKGSDYFTVIP